MDRRGFLATVGVASLAGCVSLGSSEAYECGDDCNIGMTITEFDPEEYTTTVGSTVTWRNTSSRGHTVTAIDGAIPEGAAYFASGGYDSQADAVDGWERSFGGRIDTGETYEHTFEVAGVYEYYCIPHEEAGMYGTIVVE